MNLFRTLLVAGFSTGLCSTAIHAADYYVMPAQPGPVAGTPLAAISLQATKTSPSRLQTNVNQRGNTAGKWVVVGEAPKASTMSTGAVALAAVAPVASPNPTGGLPPLAAPQPGTTYNSFAALLQAKVLQGGDRVFLMAGYHGPLSVSNQKFGSPVTVSQMPGQTAQVDSIMVTASSNLVFRDFKVWATSPNAGTGPMIRTFNGDSDITFANLDVRSVASAGNYLQWTLADWLANSRGGFLIDGSRISVIGNRVTGARHAILAGADHALVENNIIDGFADDGMRALGDFTTVRGNKVQNCHHISANHDDGLQSYSRGPNNTTGTSTVFNLTIENNKIFEWNAPVPNIVPCKLQGIGMFDGMFENLVIRNNLVVVSHYHGITVAGARKAIIANNTVVNPKGIKGDAPWIKIAAHKNGTPPTDVMVANNTVNALKVNVNATRRVATANNVVITNATAEFVSVAKQDFSLLPGAKSANAGAPAYATPADIAGVPRPKGKGPDAGAYESQ